MILGDTFTKCMRKSSAEATQACLGAYLGALLMRCITIYLTYQRILPQMWIPPGRHLSLPDLVDRTHWHELGFRRFVSARAFARMVDLPGDRPHQAARPDPAPPFSCVEPANFSDASRWRHSRGRPGRQQLPLHIARRQNEEVSLVRWMQWIASTGADKACNE